MANRDSVRVGYCRYVYVCVCLYQTLIKKIQLVARLVCYKLKTAVRSERAKKSVFNYLFCKSTDMSAGDTPDILPA